MAWQGKDAIIILLINKTWPDEARPDEAECDMEWYGLVRQGFPSFKILLDF